MKDAGIGIVIPKFNNNIQTRYNFPVGLAYIKGALESWRTSSLLGVPVYRRRKPVISKSLEWNPWKDRSLRHRLTQ